MKKILAFSAAVIFSLNGFSQAPDWQWAKGIGGKYNDAGRSIAVDAAGNSYATGSFMDTVDFDPGSGTFFLTTEFRDAFVTKLSASGNLIWSKAIRASFLGSSIGCAITVDPASGNIYLAGIFSDTVDFDPSSAVFNLISQGYWDIFVSKFDSAGNFIWTKQMGGTDFDYVESMALDKSGNIYLVGEFNGIADFDPGTSTFNLTSSGYGDIFVCKLTPSGILKWAKTVGGSGNDKVNSMAISSSGNIYTTGTFSNTADFYPGPFIFNLTSAGFEDIFISNLDSAGNFVWAKRIGGVNYEYGLSLAIDTIVNDIYITGYFYGTTDFNPGSGIFNMTSTGGSNAFVLKLNSLGSFIWAKQIAGTASTYGDLIAISPSGNGDCYVLGDFSGTADFNTGSGIFNITSIGQSDIFITKLNSSGNFSWAKTVGGSGLGLSIVLDIEENIYATGFFDSPSIAFNSLTLINADSDSTPSEDIFIAKLDTMITGINKAEKFLYSTNLSPNPFSDSSTLTFNTNNFSEGTMEIKNIFGASVSAQQHFSGNTIQLQRNNLPSGIYFYRITTKENEILNGKFIIN